MMWLLLLLQLTLDQEKALAQKSVPYYCCAVTIRARHEDGRIVHKGETRCLSPIWVNTEEETLDDDGNRITITKKIDWRQQDSYGGTIWRADKMTDTCEARDAEGHFGRAIIKWERPTSTQYIVVK